MSDLFNANGFLEVSDGVGTASRAWCIRTGTTKRANAAFQEDPGTQVTLDFEWEDDGQAAPPNEYKIVVADNASIVDVTGGFIALPAENNVVNHNFTVNKTGTVRVIVYLRRTGTANDWEANNVNGVTSGGTNQSADVLELGRYRYSMNVTQFEVVRQSDGTKPATFAVPDILEARMAAQHEITNPPSASGKNRIWLAQTDSNDSVLSGQQTVGGSTGARIEFDGAAAGATQTLASDMLDPDFPATKASYGMKTTNVRNSAIWDNHDTTPITGDGSLTAREQSSAWTHFQSSSVGFVDWETLTLSNEFDADPRVQFSSDKAQKNDKVNVPTQPRIARLYNRGEALNSGDGHNAYLVNARVDVLDETIASQSVRHAADDSEEGTLSVTKTTDGDGDTRLDFDYTVPTDANDGAAPTTSSGAPKYHRVVIDPPSEFGWWGESPNVTVDSATGTDGSFEVTSKYAADFDADTDQDLSPYDPSARTTEYVLASDLAFVAMRLRDAQHRAVGSITMTFTSTNPQGNTVDSIDRTTESDGITDEDTGTAGVQGFRATVENPSGVWTWKVEGSNDGNTGTESVSINYVSPFSGNKIQQIKTELESEPRETHRFWISYGEVANDENSIVWADGTNVSVDSTPKIEIQKFSRDTPRTQVLAPTSMTPDTGNPGDEADWYHDFAPEQERTYTVTIWATVEGQLLVNYVLFRVNEENEATVQQLGGTGLTHVGEASASGGDVDETVVTDKSITSEASADSSAEAQLSNRFDGSDTLFKVRRSDDPENYNIGDKVTHDRLGFDGLIHDVKTDGRETVLDVGVSIEESISKVEQKRRLERAERG